MLQQNNFLVYRFWIIKEVELLDVVVCVLSVLRLCRLFAVAGLLNIVEVEHVRVSDDLGGVVEQNSVRAIGKFVSEPILG